MSEHNIEEFISYYKTLPKATDFCRIYENEDGYSIYGEDAMLINQQVFKASRLKVAQSGGEVLNYVNVSKNKFDDVLNYLLFVHHQKIQILRNTGSANLPEWTVCYKASPGNIIAIEDLFTDVNSAYLQESRGIMAVKMSYVDSVLIVGVATCDPFNGIFKISEFADNSELLKLQSVIMKLHPHECILPTTSLIASQSYPKAVLEKIIKSHEIALTECNSGDFSAADIVQYLNRLLYFDEGTDFENSMKDEAAMMTALCAVSEIIRYLGLMNDVSNFGIYSLYIFLPDLYAKVDSQSIRELALFPENSKDFHNKDFLLGHLNNCVSKMGERLLLDWIKRPLTDLRKLKERFDLVEVFIQDFSLKKKLRRIISSFPDIDCICRKIQRRKASLEDLYKIYVMLKQLPDLLGAISKYEGHHEDFLKSNFAEEFEFLIDVFSNYVLMIENYLDFDALKNFEFAVTAACDVQLYDVRQRIKKKQQIIKSKLFEVQYDLENPTIKLKCCEVIGYHYRLPEKEAERLYANKSYIVIARKSSFVYFQSFGLKLVNQEYLSLKMLYERLQQKHVDELIDAAASYLVTLKDFALSIATIDVIISFATVSNKKGCVRPKLRKKDDCYIILEDARHPMLETKIEKFVPNDVKITKGKHRFYFITGPDKGGKSTYIRTVALNVFLGQIGCFVPCEFAEVSIIDAFFTHIGACKTSSTLGIEMTKIQAILKSATSSSLLIIDEIGPRTSDLDEFPMSWAISWYIAETLKSPCLFATDLKKLTELSKHFPSVGNLHVEAVITKRGVSCLYIVNPGVCDKNFKVKVAEVVEFPKTVIEEACDKLTELVKVPMIADEIKGVFKNVPGGEIIINALDDGERLEALSNALEKLVIEQGL